MLWGVLRASPAACADRRRPGLTVHVSVVVCVSGDVSEARCDAAAVNSRLRAGLSTEWPAGGKEMHHQGYECMRPMYLLLTARFTTCLTQRPSLVAPKSLEEQRSHFPPLGQADVAILGVLEVQPTCTPRAPCRY